MLKETVFRSFVILWSLLAVSASAQVWVESGDAPSFPDGPAQVTRGEVLDTISGSTGAGDLRDAYCIRIVEPNSFLATTDPATSPTANADFDTRLFLFRADGAPVLANDDTPPSQPPHLSTLTGAANDGSGFVLSQPGDYVLVVAGSPEDPQDPTDLDLFDIDSALDAVHSPDPAAGRFDHWEQDVPGVGAYTIVIEGVSPCQNSLDAVFTDHNPNKICVGDGLGGFTCSEIHTDGSLTRDVALGFVNGDDRLDVVFAMRYKPNRLCLGNGLGNFNCTDVSPERETWSFGVALGFIDLDQNLDAIFANENGLRNRVCLGDGLGGFNCGDVSADQNNSQDVALGFVNGDPYLDAVIANGGENKRNRVCLGDGLGGFNCDDVGTNFRDENFTLGVALGLVNSDPHLDAVFANGGVIPRNRVCLGDGKGDFACMDVGTDEHTSYSVALGCVDGDEYLDAVFATAASIRNRLCLGDGGGSFFCSDVSTDENATYGVALGFVDEDDFIDATFANVSPSTKQVCLGDGEGSFTCSDVDSETNGIHHMVALGDVVQTPWPFCFDFDNLCDGLEITSVLPDKTVVAIWRNWDCAGATAPMLGGYSGKNVSPRLSWLAADPDATLAPWNFNLNVDARTFDLWVHDADFNLIQLQDDQPFSVTPGACSFGPEKAGLPASTEVVE